MRRRGVMKAGERACGEELLRVIDLPAPDVDEGDLAFLATDEPKLRGKLLALGNQSILELIEAPRHPPHRLACSLDWCQSAGEDGIPHLICGKLSIRSMVNVC